MPRLKHRPLVQLSEDTLNKFWRRVLVGNLKECWPWLGTENVAGYGQFFADHKLWTAHRVAYFSHFRLDPGDLEVCHKCDNPPCQNWDHLFVGTHLDNVRDCMHKGRFTNVKPVISTDHYRATFSKADVQLMRELYACGDSLTMIKHKFGTTSQYVYNIVTRRSRIHE